MMCMPLEKSPQRIAVLADQCVQCGLCLPVCPTYALDGNETESPRGRIAIANALAKGQVSATPSVRAHLDHCLGCLNCERVCPAGVQYGELLLETRALLGPSSHRPRILLELVKRPALMRALRRLAGWTRFHRWKARVLQHLPARSAWRVALSNLPAELPAPATQPRRSRTDSSGLPRLALFPGCVASIDDAAAQQAAITLLQAAGFEMTLLPAHCCGALDAHAGVATAAEKAAQGIRSAWQDSAAEQLLTVTPGCLGTLRRALPGVTVTDPYALLAKYADRLRFRPRPQRAALHLPCTQVNVARSEAALLALLRRIPELQVTPLPTPPHCCGAAGSHLLEFPDRAAQLRDATLRQAETLAPQLLLSSNIGCRLHLAAGLGERAAMLPTLHPLTLLAQQLEAPGTTP